MWLSVAVRGVPVPVFWCCYNRISVPLVTSIPLRVAMSSAEFTVVAVDVCSAADAIKCNRYKFYVPDGCGRDRRASGFALTTAIVCAHHPPLKYCRVPMLNIKAQCPTAFSSPLMT